MERAGRVYLVIMQHVPIERAAALVADLTKHPGGHQLCCAHLLRDLADAAETYPDAHGRPQATRALRGLIHASNTARDNGFTTVPEPLAALQSEDTTRDRLTIRSYLTTATKSGTGALTALRDAITGTPWTPSPAPGGLGHFSPRLPQFRT